MFHRQIRFSLLSAAFLLGSSSLLFAMEEENPSFNALAPHLYSGDSPIERPDPKKFSTPFKALIALANGGDIDAQDKVATLLYKSMLPYNLHSSIEAQDWFGIQEKMEQDPRYLYLAYVTKGSSCFLDYFLKFYEMEKIEENPHKLLILGYMYENGHDDKEADLEKAVSLYKRVLEIKKDIYLPYPFLAQYYTSKDKHELAKFYYQEGSELGNLFCTYRLATLHDPDYANPPVEDEEKENQAKIAFTLYQKAVLFPNSCAQVGGCLAEGKGVTQNVMEALRYMIKGGADHSKEYISLYLSPMRNEGQTDDEVIFADINTDDLLCYSQPQQKSHDKESGFAESEYTIDSTFRRCDNLIAFELEVLNCLEILKEYQKKKSVGLLLSCFTPSEDFLSGLGLQENPPFFAVHSFKGRDFLTIGEEMVPLAHYLMSIADPSPVGFIDHDETISSFKEGISVIEDLNVTEQGVLTITEVEVAILRKKIIALKRELKKLEVPSQDKEESEKESNSSDEISKKISLRKKILEKLIVKFNICNEVIKETRENISNSKKEMIGLLIIKRKLKQFILSNHRNEAFFDEYDFLRPVAVVEGSEDTES